MTSYCHKGKDRVSEVVQIFKYLKTQALHREQTNKRPNVTYCHKTVTVALTKSRGNPTAQTPESIDERKTYFIILLYGEVTQCWV